MRRALCLASAVWVLAAPLEAQSGNESAWVLPGGMVRVGIAVDFSHFDARFTGGGTEPLGADLGGPLHAGRFAPLFPLLGGIRAFVAETGGGIDLDAEDLSVGDLDARLSSDVRRLPIELAIGLFDRFEVGMTVPVHRSETEVTRLVLSSGTVGVNPAPEANAAAFALISPGFEELGRAPLLPVAGSALGEELIRRVREHGGELRLPEDAAGLGLFQSLLQQEFGIAALERDVSPWEVGDAEAAVRVRILASFGTDPLPPDSGTVHYRVAGRIAARLPTGTEREGIRLVSASPRAGLTGWSGGVAGDLFFGPRWWVAGGLSYSAVGETEVVRRAVPPGEPFSSAEPPVRARWSPGSEIGVSVSPRFRPDPAIAVGLEYRSVHAAGSTLAVAGADPIPWTRGGTYARVGASVRFTTLAAYAAGSRVLPGEAALSYTADLAGPPGAPVAREIRIEGRLYQRLWSR